MNSKSSLAKFGRYILTGGSAAVVDLGVFALLYPAFLPLAVAAACSFVLAAIENYILTSYFVFSQKLSFWRFGAFLVFASVGLVVNVGMTLAAVKLTGCPPVFAKLIGIGSAFLLNFWLNNVVVFKKKDVAVTNG